MLQSKMYKNSDLVQKISSQISAISRKKINIMEVCGGHTMAIQRYGIPSLLPDTISLISGPGCPVCVTSRQFIDHSVALSRQPGIVIATFGDLIRVPGSTSSLQQEKSQGGDIRVVYSILDALKIAAENPAKHIVFPGIGFETTAPGTAAGIRQAKKMKLKNFSVLSAHKVMPPAMTALIDEGVEINGYLAPGHVSTITGTSIYREIPEKFGTGVVVAGFEPVDIMLSVLMLVKQIEEDKPGVEIQYRRAVKPEGNLKAQQLMKDVFVLKEDWWRGLGILPESGLKISENYREMQTENRIEVEIEPTKEDRGCICGEILKGKKTPKDCRLYGTTCNPVNPVGACMVSHEGSCHAYFRYNRQ